MADFQTSMTSTGTSESFTNEAEFELLWQLKPGLWLAARTNDLGGEKFLARRMEDFPKDKEGVGLEELMFNGGMASLVFLTLSHENLVSLVGQMEQIPVGTVTQDNVSDQVEPERYLLSDYCDASNLSVLLSQRAQDAEAGSVYLPESLCWHVLRALLRAVTFLHDGKRYAYDFSASESQKLRKWQLMDPTWHAILHRQIKPENVFFQHSRGREIYGPCKLGNFTKAVVTCYMPRSADKPARKTPRAPAVDVSVNADSPTFDNPLLSEGIALAVEEDWEPRAEILGKFKRDPESVAKGQRLYTLREEMFSIGSIIFTMMTGLKVLKSCDTSGLSHVVRCSVDGCLQRECRERGDCTCVVGGCEHLSDKACQHEKASWKLCEDQDCSEPNVNIHDALTRAPYTNGLRQQVYLLLAFDGKSPQQGLLARASEYADQTEVLYWAWRRWTVEGQRFRDVEDEMMDKWVSMQERTEQTRLAAELMTQSQWETYIAPL